MTTDVIDRPAIVSPSPPAARAAHVLEQRPAIERELADLKLQVAEAALAAYEGKPDSRKNLAALDTAIRTVAFQLECNGLAHQLAQRLDREAVAAWRASIDAADPEEMIAGITKKACCKRCSGDHGCVINGSVECAHPILIGGLNPRHQDKPAVRARWRAAAQKLGVYR